MKKNDKVTLTIFVFLIILTIIITPALKPVSGIAGNVTHFNVTLAVNSGSPSITYVDVISDSPNEGTTKTVSFYFNATHPNGVVNIPAAGANIQINRTGVTLTQAGACIIKSTSGITNRYECNITLNYYNLPGLWTINASITDLAANKATNTSISYTNGNTYGITLRTPDVSFGGSPGATDIASTPSPQWVNNTGNVAFNQINLTAYNLQSGTNFIGAGNFTANTTNSAGPGHILANNTPVTLIGSTIAVQGSRDIYLYADIPLGTANGTYTNIDDWVVSVN